MAELGCYSPSFKKPSDVLRMRRKRARSEGPDRRTESSVVSIRPFSPGPLGSAQGRARGRGGGVKRRNPFANLENAHNSPKKRALAEGKVAAVSDELLKVGVSLREELLKTVKTAPVPLAEDDGLLPEDPFEPLGSAPELKSPEPVSPAAPCSEFPADWSLKTRVLFTSPGSFSWTEQMKAQEEAQGLSAHCRNQSPALPADIPDPRVCAELRTGFQQSLQFWQHPSFSWLSLFPRIGAERHFSGKCQPWAQDAALQQSLMSDWSVSLSSLYGLLKARLCPFFYLCSYQLTVLFRAAGVSGSGGVTALLSPSTRGLREAMRAEGIEFSLPLLDERRNSQSDGSDVVKEQQEPEEEEDEDEDGGFSWLKEMGVQDQIKKPDAISIKLRQEHREVRLDHRPESVVLVEGPHTFTLLNFLINCKSLVAGAGSQAGLPPTLLAPTPFRGATLHSLKTRSVNVKTQVRTGYQDVCSLEVTGPIMPHALHTLTHLLTAAQRGEFSCSLYTHEPTAVLNVPITGEQTPQLECVCQDLGRCGVQQSCVQQLAAPSMLGKCALRQLHMRARSYSWTS